jgi:hypothetical protein
MSEKPKVHPLQRAWAAGIFDGKAVIQRTGTLMFIDSTEESLIRRFHATIGLGSIIERDRKDSRHSYYHIWRWEVKALDDSREVILFVAPFLSPRKTAACADMLGRIESNPYWKKKYPEKAANLVVGSTPAPNAKEPTR